MATFQPLFNIPEEGNEMKPTFLSEIKGLSIEGKDIWTKDTIKELVDAQKDYYKNEEKHLAHKMEIDDIIRAGLVRGKINLKTGDNSIHELNIHKTKTTEDLMWMAIGSLVISPIIFLINYLINKLVNLAWKKALFIFIMVICVNFAIYKVYMLKIKDFDVERWVIITFLVVYQINLFDDLYSEFQKEDLKAELTKMRLNATSGLAVGGEVKGYEAKEHKELDEPEEYETDAELETTESDTQSEF